MHIGAYINMTYFLNAQIFYKKINDSYDSFFLLSYHYR
jgi:hypothetical protein